jgi:hypothetical protein
MIHIVGTHLELLDVLSQAEQVLQGQIVEDSSRFIKINPEFVRQMQIPRQDVDGPRPALP